MCIATLPSHNGRVSSLMGVSCSSTHRKISDDWVKNFPLADPPSLYSTPLSKYLVYAPQSLQCVLWNEINSTVLSVVITGEHNLEIKKQSERIQLSKTPIVYKWFLVKIVINCWDWTAKLDVLIQNYEPSVFCLPDPSLVARSNQPSAITYNLRNLPL